MCKFKDSNRCLLRCVFCVQAPLLSNDNLLLLLTRLLRVTGITCQLAPVIHFSPLPFLPLGVASPLLLVPYVSLYYHRHYRHDFTINCYITRFLHVNNAYLHFVMPMWLGSTPPMKKSLLGLTKLLSLDIYRWDIFSWIETVHAPSPASLSLCINQWSIIAPRPTKLIIIVVTLMDLIAWIQYRVE